MFKIVSVSAAFGALLGKQVGLRGDSADLTLSPAVQRNLAGTIPHLNRGRHAYRLAMSPALPENPRSCGPVASLPQMAAPNPGLQV